MEINKMYIGKSVSEDTVIFRYLDILKFLNLIVSKQLYFTNYKYFSDKYETEITEKFLIDFATSADTDMENKTMQSLSNYYLNRFVNCWNISETEQYLLWKTYCQNIYSGVVIKSSVKNLRDSLESLNELIFACDRIHYISYSHEPEHIDKPVFTKYDFYSSENEIRVSTIIDHSEENDKGVLIPIDLNILIDKIILSSRSPYFQTITSVIESIMGRDFLASRLSESLIDDTSLK